LPTHLSHGSAHPVSFGPHIVRYANPRSTGGTLITHAGVDSRVAALVYIAALGPDETETSQGQQDKFPKTDVFKYVEVADGRVWMRPEGVSCFAGDIEHAIPVIEQQECCEMQANAGRRLWMQ
jgi:hypothetical protein